MGMVHPFFLCHGGRPFYGRAGILHAVSRKAPPSLLESETTRTLSTSAGLYYFSAKLAPPKYAALASWITGWANITGQITLVCSIDFTWSVSLFLVLLIAPVLTTKSNSAQMITSAITVGSNGAIVLSSGATYGILLAVLFCHGLVCSAATSVLARLNLFYVMINRESLAWVTNHLVSDEKCTKWGLPWLRSSLCSFAPVTTRYQQRMHLRCSRTIQVGSTVCRHKS